MTSFKRAVLAMPFAMLMGSGAASAASWDVTVTNLTHGNHFAPLLLTATPHDTHLFTLGSAASSELQALAECGDLSMLVGSAALATADNQQNPAGGTLGPGLSTTTTITTTDTNNTHLTVVGMILPSNDGFIGLDSQHVPAFDATAGANNTYTYYLNGYDAGTEGNDEVLYSGAMTCMPGDGANMPGPLPGTDIAGSGSGVSTADTNQTVHVHRGTMGDAVNDGAGSSDLNSTIHRWQNPIAKVVVTVTQ